MAMPTRSVRTTEFGEKAPTPVAIGPGSYLGIREATKTRPSLAGFASSEPRSWQGGASTPTGPGPGSYVGSTQAVPNENDIRPTSCFESRAPRLAPQYTGSTPFASSTVVEVPGPGSYQTSPPIPGAYVQPESHGVWPRHESVPGLAKRFNPPSVPRREQSFGYNLDSRGQLLALPAPFAMRTGSRIDCAGPGDYDPQDKDWWRVGTGSATFRKGSRKTVFDEEWVVKDARPGPGDYNPKLRPRYHLEMPGSSAFMSGVPKGGGAQYEVGPGPGQYIHQNPLGAGTSASNVPRLSSPNLRGAWLRSDKCPFNEPETGNVPGPGAYGGLQDNSSFNKVAPKTLTDEKIGFNSTGRRTSPGPSRHTENMPGPGEYDLGMQSIVGGLKYKRRIGCKGVFGSSGDRFRPQNGADMNVNPTPMQLWDQGKVLKRVVVLRQVPKSTSSFKSEAERFRVHSAPDHAGKSPITHYVRKDSFDEVVEKGSKSKSRSFLSTSQRFERGAFDSKDIGDKPGPGAYNVAVVKTAVPPPRSRSQPRSRLPRSLRFGNTLESYNSVGPGSHEIAGSLIKKTFNITFGGAYTSSGAGRVVHRVIHDRKPEGEPRLVVALPGTQISGDSKVLDSLGLSENNASNSATAIRAAA